MSNQKLFQATIPGFEGPIFDGMEKFQEFYTGGRFKHLPMKKEFLEYCNEQFKMIFFPRARFTENFVTEDGTPWFCQRVGIYDTDCKVLYPKGRDRHHEDGTVSSQHVALYLESGHGLTPTQIAQVIQTYYAFMLMSRRSFPH